jgi:hypothetical protein
MTHANVMNKAQLLSQIEQGWNEFNAYLRTLTEEQLTVPTDAAGWTGKDHLVHIAFWEDSIQAMLNGQPYREFLAIGDPTVESDDVETINALIQQRHQMLSASEVLNRLGEVHHQVIEKIQSISDADLKRPCRSFQPDAIRDEPVMNWMMDNSYGHFAEHQPWIAAIVAQRNPLMKANEMNKTELLSQMEKNWKDFYAYLQSLSEEQLTQRTDAAGWTVKDHIIHLAVWEDGGIALLEGSPQRERMEIDEAIWRRWNFDEINAVIQQRHQQMPLADVLQTFQDVHRRLTAKVETLSESDLQRLVRPDKPDSITLCDVVVINSYAHYAEHQPWIAAIVGEK